MKLKGVKVEMGPLASALAIVLGVLLLAGGWGPAVVPWGAVAAAQSFPASDGGPDPAPFSVEPAPYDLARVVERALAYHLGVRVSRLQADVVERQTTEQQAALKPSLSVTVLPAWFETPVPDLDALDFDLDRLRDIIRDTDWAACFADFDNCDDLDNLADEFEEQVRSVAEQLADGIPQKLEPGRSHSVTLNGSLPLWRSPLQRAVADAAAWRLDRAAADVEEAAAGAIMQSIDAYFGVLRAEAAVHMAQLTLEQRETHRREVEDRVRAGTATTMDLLQAEAERHGAEARLMQARGELTAARMTLNSVLGLDLNVPLQLADPSAELSRPGSIRSATDVLAGGGAGDALGVADALRQAAEGGAVRQAYADWRLADAGAVIAAEQAKPSLRFVGTGKWPEAELSFGIDRHGYLGGSIVWSQTYLNDERVESDEPFHWFAGFEMTWTLFDGGRRQAEVEAAQLQARQAELYYEHLAQTVRTDVLAAYVRWQAAEEAVVGVRRGVEAAAEGVAVAEQLAAAGAATRAAVLQAEIGLAQARQAYLDALYGSVMAHTAYLNAAGQLVAHWEAALAARP